ncbi:MAG: hypothetical protein FJY75_04140 [Candidatus Eisenbacteria bacterium]|uniref:Uncharacterized protein n=1 Tax=Eiseniibacteriota bacterium TaxID=2212470 RepID=A0A938BLH1_UNCEI|nr:hypothetical protein [Candidatus Eisenbacteria bacterium]
MKRTGPVLLGFVIGMLMLVQHFTPDRWIAERYNNILDWKQVVFGLTLILGVVSLFLYHWRRIARREEGWRYSLLTVGGLAFMIGAAILFTPSRGPYPWMFEHVQAPMQSTLFALLAFYVASASYRAFRARNLHAALLLSAGVIVMLGRVPLGEAIGLNHISTWILDYPNLAAKRGVMIGVGLGMTATAIKIILGIERTYLGRGA